MGYDLANEKRVLSLTNGNWAWLLETAVANGWQPNGTEQPEDWTTDWKGSNWSGNYSTSDGQLVTGADAMSFAKALRHELASVAIKADPFDGVERVRAIEARHHGDAMAEEVANFAEEGAFRIW